LIEDLKNNIDMKKIFILCFMIMTMVLNVKHLRAQSLWAENSNTGQREYFTLNQQLSYNLNTSTNFHKCRVIGFTDSTIRVQIKGNRLVTIRFGQLRSLYIPRRGGRSVGGALVLAFGTISLLAGITSASSHSTAPPSNNYTGMSSGSFGPTLPRGVNGEVLAAGLVTVPIGIALIHGKTINFEKYWELKTNKIPEL
jgi:hypothetical protein